MPSPDGRCEPDADMSAHVADGRSFRTGSRPYDSPAGVATLVGLVRMIGVVAVLVGIAEAGAGVAFHEPRATTLGSMAIIYGVWVATRVNRLAGADRERTITWIASMTLVLIGSAAFLQPSEATAMAIASLLPAVIVTPIVSSRIVLRLLILSGLVAAWSVGIEMALPNANTLPEAAQSAIAFVTLVLAYAFLIVFLWEVSRRLKSTATLDPRLVGDRIAVHIARAVGADDCALSYWDRATNRVLTLGYEPPERRGALNETYAVDDFPATRAVLDTQEATLIDVDDPSADRAEIDYLRSIGHRSMAMIPLVAAGRTIGLVEVTAARGNDARRRGRDGARERPPLRRDPAPGAPRRTHRPRQSSPLSRSRRARGGAESPLRRPPRSALHRPRRLQDDQRPPRPRPRR